MSATRSKHGLMIRRARRWCVLILAVGAVGLGCSAFNPAFLDVLDSGGVGGGFSSLDNAPGHVVIAFVNNAEVDERLVSYLLTTGGLALTDAERRALRPRVRFRVLVTFVGGATMPIEFIAGSRNLIDQRFDALAFPDLNQNDLNNVVVLCDVASVELQPGSPVEVFVPVELIQYQRVAIGGAGGVQTEFQFVEDLRIAPHFEGLEVDTVDEDGDVTIQRNIGLRDTAAPVNQLLCGSVISIVLNGTLDVPFLDGVDDDPSYDEQDLATVARIGGRYEFLVTTQ